MKGPFMKSPVRYLRFVLPLLLLFPSSLFAQTDEYVSVKKWETFDFAGQSLKSADAAALEEWELKLVRGIVFGKHGRVFKDPEIRRYLESRPWFKADPNFQNSSLNDAERQNLDVIRIAEAQKHDTVQPGDMRLYQSRA